MLRPRPLTLHGEGGGSAGQLGQGASRLLPGRRGGLARGEASGHWDLVLRVLPDKLLGPGKGGKRGTEKRGAKAACDPEPRGREERNVRRGNVAEGNAPMPGTRRAEREGGQQTSPVSPSTKWGDASSQRLVRRTLGSPQPGPKFRHTSPCPAVRYLPPPAIWPSVPQRNTGWAEAHSSRWHVCMSLA